MRPRRRPLIVFSNRQSAEPDLGSAGPGSLTLLRCHIVTLVQFVIKTWSND